MQFNEFSPVGEPKKYDPTVARVQQILQQLGYDLGPTGVDGIVGPFTKTAYYAFMNNMGANANKVKKSAAPTMNPSKGIMMPVDAKVGQKYKGHAHPGVDIPVPVGTPVRAPQDGYVSQVGNSATAGLFVNISDEHGQLAHRLLHLSKISVKQDQHVDQGDIIGYSGNTGRSTGPHLHWERYVAGRLTDPMTA